MKTLGKILALFSVFLALPAFGQRATVTGTVNSNWAGGSIVATFQPQGGGRPSPLTTSANLNASGAFTLNSAWNNTSTQYRPSTTQFTISVCNNPVTTFTVHVTITSASQDISSSFSGAPTPSCSGAASAVTSIVAGTNVTISPTNGLGDVTINASGAGLSSFTTGNLSPVFTAALGANPTTAPALAFTLSAAAQNSVFAGPASGGAGAPSYQTAPTFSAANLTSFPTFNQSTTGNASTATNLSTTGTANQVWGMNSGATAQGWQTLTPGTTTLQTNGSNISTQTALNLINSTTNAVGLTATFSNPTGSNVKVEITGGSYTGNAATATTATSATSATTATNVAGGATGSLPYQSASATTAMLTGNTAATDQVLVSHGTGSAAQAPTLSNSPALSAANMTAFPTLNQNTTGTAANLSGTPALPNGTTATTQSAADNTAKVATDAFVLANSLSNPMSSVGDTIYGGTAGAATRLAGPTTGTVAYNECSTPSGGVATAPTWCLPGVSGRSVTGTTDTIAATDRLNIITYNSASAVAVTLTSAATLGNNFAFSVTNQNAGTVTFTPGAGTINGGSTLAILEGDNCAINSPDNTNYIARCSPGQVVAGTGITVTPSATGKTVSLTARYGSCTELWGGSGTSFALTSGDDAISNNSCYNDSGVTRTITAVKCRSTIASNTTTVNPTFGASGTGTTILSGALTCGSSLAYSSTGTVSNSAWTTGTGITPAMGGTLTGTSIAMIIEYTTPQ